LRGSSLSVRLNPGQLFLSIAGSVGKPCITSINCCIHDGFVYFRTWKGDPRFLYYVFASGEPYKGLGKLGTQLNLNTDTVGAIPIALPCIDEQVIISNFLDRETAKIDTLIAKKQSLIEKLKEKRSSLISRTVTRGLPPDAARAAGLNPRVSFKPSGVSWLGEMPQHWQVTRLRYKSLILDCKHLTASFVDNGIPVASIREVAGFTVNLSNAKQTTEEEYYQMIEGGRKPVAGDIIYSRNATVGDAALVRTDERFCLGQDVCLIRPSGHDPRFFLYLFRSKPLLQQVESLMIGSTFRRINVSQIKAFWIALPERSEQSAIADFLDSELTRLEHMIEKADTVLSRLQEYRAVLIASAVSGKIDVRGLA
jgi:type I restriction enzyme S subunit